MFGQATNDAIAPGSQHQHTKRMLHDCKIRGFRLLEMQPILEQALEGDTEQPFSWELYLQSDLAATPTNGHPSKRLHSMAARLLYDDLVSSGMLAEFVSDD